MKGKLTKNSDTGKLSICVCVYTRHYRDAVKLNITVVVTVVPPVDTVLIC